MAWVAYQTCRRCSARRRKTRPGPQRRLCRFLRLLDVRQGYQKEKRVYILVGNDVRFTGPESEPHGAVLSASADHGLSLGHIKAAGPILSKTAVAGAARSIAPARTLIMEGILAVSCCWGWAKGMFGGYSVGERRERRRQHLYTTTVQLKTRLSRQAQRFHVAERPFQHLFLASL